MTDTKRKHEERKEGSSTDPVRVAHACARLIHGRDTHRGAHVGVPPHRPIHPPIFSHFPSYTRSGTGPSHAHTTRHVHTMLPRMHSQEGRAREGRYREIHRGGISVLQLLHVHTHTWPRMMYAPAYQPVAIYKHRRKRIRGGESDRDGTMGQPGAEG